MRRVLVVDDDEGTRDSFSLILMLEGIPVITAATAEEGLVSAAHPDVGLVLADLWLPQCTGVELVADLRAKGVHTPVVIITAYASTRNVVAAMQAGATDCLDKPIDDVTLLQVVRARLGSSCAAHRDGCLTSRALALVQCDSHRQHLTAEFSLGSWVCPRRTSAGLSSR